MITIAFKYATADDDMKGAPLLQQKSKAGGKRKNNDDEAEIAYIGLPIMTPNTTKGGGKGGNRSGDRDKGQKGASGGNGASSSQDVPFYFHNKEERLANHMSLQSA
jgi:hypothetical protein